MKRRIGGLLLASIVVSGVGANPLPEAALAPLVGGLGDHHHPVANCTGPAQAFFDQGLSLYYGFRYPEALASFQEASRRDPDCPMTHWGEALAIAPTPNSRYIGFVDDPTGAGAEAIARAVAMRDVATEKERRLIDALHALYDVTSEPDRTRRDTGYAERLREIAADYPDDTDVAVLYTQALMTKSTWDYWTPDGRPRPGTREALAALEQVLARDIDHPGANHLYIHLLEDSQNPEAALPHAERLAATMPGVGHMVHMPTHIYIRTGQYAKAIALNERSIEAANALTSAWGTHSLPMGVPSLSSSDRTHGSHALDFIHLAAVLQGNFERAMAVAEQSAASAAAHLERFGGFQRRYVKPLLTLRRFAQWDAVLARPLPPAEFPFVRAIAHFVRGSAFAHRGDIDAARAELAALDATAAHADMAALRVWVNSAATLLRIASGVLNGEIAAADNAPDQAIFHYNEAIRLEDGLNYMEPPDWGHPVRLELGTLLLDLGRAREAETVFWEDLRRNPENGWALNGVRQSLKMQALPAREAEVAARFESAWANADTHLHHGRARPE